MATPRVCNYTKSIIPLINTGMEENESYLWDQDKKLCCELKKQMHFLFGDGLSTNASTREQASDNKESIVQCLEMNRRTKARNSSDKLTSLLISSGAIAGITPTSIRKQLGATIPGFVSLPQDGNGADIQKRD